MTYLPLHIPTFLFIEKPFMDSMFKEHPQEKNSKPDATGWIQ